MRPPTFTFEPFKRVLIAKKEARKRGVTVNLKHGYIVFPKAYIIDNGLDGRYLKWFVDIEKKALGWRILEKERSLDALQDYFQLKKVPSTGVYQLSIRRVLNAFNFSDTNATFSDLEVGTYISKQEYFNDGTLHYVMLTDPKPVQQRKRKLLNETAI